jgi:ribosomal protein S18 acetylase RimI-like enzyme
MLIRDDFHVIVALENDGLVGGLTAYEMQMFKSEITEMFLYEIEVAESHRQKGIGKALIESLKQICVEKGIAVMFVGTEKDNFPARKLYTSTGGDADEDSVWFNYLF